MTKILAMDTATEACSVALYDDGAYREIYEVIPRRHSQRLFGMLQQLLPDGDLRRQGVDAIAYGSGPGSFTGLRICASAVQGLAFANALPAVPVSTLAAQVQVGIREGLLTHGDNVLSTIDAQIGEIYWALYRVQDELPELCAGPGISRPENLVLDDDGAGMVGLGSGMNYLANLPAPIKRRLRATHPALLPHARDLVPLALGDIARNALQRADQVNPVYVRDEISWKKLAEQGKPA